MATAEDARIPGSVIRIEGTELRTACGHSFATCHSDRCFRLPPDLQAERNRMRTVAATEHEKNVTREAARFVAELRDIETAYRRRAEMWDVQSLPIGTEVSFPASEYTGYATRGRVTAIFAASMHYPACADIEFWVDDEKFVKPMQFRTVTPIEPGDACAD